MNTRCVREAQGHRTGDLTGVGMGRMRRGRVGVRDILKVAQCKVRDMAQSRTGHTPNIRTGPEMQRWDIDSHTSTKWGQAEPCCSHDGSDSRWRSCKHSQTGALSNRWVELSTHSGCLGLLDSPHCLVDLKVVVCREGPHRCVEVFIMQNGVWDLQRER